MLDLLDYRRQVAELYRTVRIHGPGAAPCDDFRRDKDTLFRTHPQTPLDSDRLKSFVGLSYYPYDASFRVTAEMTTNERAESIELNLGRDGICIIESVGQVAFDLPTGSGVLTVYWIQGYGGGLFLPYRDATCGAATYGGGRYLIDTIKGADLGTTGEQLVLDFNYGYHPSCAYSGRWVCPLAPPANRLPFPIPVGERLS